MDFDTIRYAVETVSSPLDSTGMAYINRETGELFLESDFDDQTPRIPDDAETDPAMVPVPSKYDLDIGQQLVWDFVRQELPEREAEVRQFFRRRGAYQRYKSFLENMGRLEDWYAFEEKNTVETILAWANNKGIRVDDTDRTTASPE
jgi:hypothetical protein